MENKAWKKPAKNPWNRLLTQPATSAAIPGQHLITFYKLQQKNQLTNANFINSMNHSINNQKGGNSQCISGGRLCTSLVDVREVDSVLNNQTSKSCSILRFEFTGSEVMDNVVEFESKYCRSNPLNNVPWAKEEDDKTDEVFETNRLNNRSSPTLPDFSNWAALFLENNPSY